jgi:DNA-cytosine methyltransferase
MVSGGNKMFTFIDLFAGIGGIRLAFEKQGGECVFTSEWDTNAQKVYKKNFKDKHDVFGDITKKNEKDIPDHDILLAGFPCQPFSLAGVSKKNSLGIKHGFEDETQGTLFFDIKRIIKEKRPKAFLLENVKNLKSHDNGRTFKVIMRTLERELGYKVYTKVLDAKGLVPQHRERIYIVGFRDNIDFQFPILRNDGPKLFEIMEKDVETKYTLSDNLWSYLQEYASKHREKGNGFGYGIADPNAHTRTLSARYYKDGSEILIYQGENKNPRRLTPRECARLQGFPDSFQIADSDSAAYKQFGNSVAVPVVEEIAKNMISAIKENKPNTRYHRGYLVGGSDLGEIIERIKHYRQVFYKIVTPRDYKASLSRSGGIIIDNKYWKNFFEEPCDIGLNLEKNINIFWEQVDEITESKIRWYGKKKSPEYKLTHIGKKVPFFSEEYLGQVVIFIKVNAEEYLGYMIDEKDLTYVIENCYDVKVNISVELM